MWNSFRLNSSLNESRVTPAPHGQVFEAIALRRSMPVAAVMPASIEADLAVGCGFQFILLVVSGSGLVVGVRLQSAVVSTVFHSLGVFGVDFTVGGPPLFFFLTSVSHLICVSHLIKPPSFILKGGLRVPVHFISGSGYVIVCVARLSCFRVARLLAL